MARHYQNKAKRSRTEKLKMIENREWFSARSIWGCANWAIQYYFLGAREAGKSYDIMKYFINCYKKKGAKLYWLRLNEASSNKMLKNNAKKMVDPDLYRTYNLDLTVKGDDVYNHGNKFATVLALSTAHNTKGVAEFDKDYKGPIIIVLDEFELEKGQKRTFDVVYNLVEQIENLVRSRKKDIKIIFIGNTTEEASDVLARLNFIPEKFGIFKLKSKKAVVVNMKPTEAYKARRAGTFQDIMAAGQSNYTNVILKDTSLIYKKRLIKPLLVIKFSKNKDNWYTLWDDNIIVKYNGEKKQGISMRRYIDENFIPEQRDKIFELYDTRAFRYRDLITQTLFGYELSLIRRQ